MPQNKENKKDVVKNLKEIFKGAKSLVFVNFHGLKVSQSSELRRNLRKGGLNYLVAKKTLIRKALEGVPFQGELPPLGGEVALAYGGDLISPSREVYEFQKKNKENISILGGIFDGEYKNQEEMTSIASIPTTQVLYGQFVNLINSPIQGFVMALSEIAKQKEAK